MGSGFSVGLSAGQGHVLVSGMAGDQWDDQVVAVPGVMVDRGVRQEDQVVAVTGVVVDRGVRPEDQVVAVAGVVLDRGVRFVDHVCVAEMGVRALCLDGELTARL